MNGDGRPDLYVANDEDPNRLYLNKPRRPARLPASSSRAQREGVADPNAGMGVAAERLLRRRPHDLFVSNSRGQGHAVYRAAGAAFTDARRPFAPPSARNLTGWGDSWVDLNNDGHLDLVLANGDIPVKNLAKDARPIQVLEHVPSGFVDATRARRR